MCARQDKIQETNRNHQIKNNISNILLCAQTDCLCEKTKRQKQKQSTGSYIEKQEKKKVRKKVGEREDQQLG